MSNSSGHFAVPSPNHTLDDGNGGDGLQYNGFLQSHDIGDSLRSLLDN